MSVGDVKELPWWEYELLLDGLRAEFTDDSESEGAQGGEFVPMSLESLGIKPTQM